MLNKLWMLFVIGNLCMQTSWSHPAEIKHFKASWLAHALHLQRTIDLHTPINAATFLGTHNSYNSVAYQTPARYVSPNQILSIYDQLEIGIRSIELDAHWTLTPTLKQAILLCHGDPDHTGCDVSDRPFTAALAEIRRWVQQNPQEVILLYIERHLDGHEPQLSAELEEYLGTWLFKPAAIRTSKVSFCLSLPTNLTKADILRAGKQIIIVTKGCDGLNPPFVDQKRYPAWNDYGFAGIGSIPKRPFEFIDVVPDEFSAYPDCGRSNAFKDDSLHTSLWRVYEDGRIDRGHRYPLDVSVMRDMVRCGINWQTLDEVTPDDPRLPVAVWSWAPDYPKPELGHCIIYQKQHGIINRTCTGDMAGVACRNDLTQGFRALGVTGPLNKAEAVCQRVAGLDWHFATPINGQQMNSLRLSMAKMHLDGIWLNSHLTNDNAWVVGSLD